MVHPISEHAEEIARFLARAADRALWRHLTLDEIQTVANELIESQMANCPYPHLPWDKD